MSATLPCLRGCNAAQVTIYVDGVPQNLGQDGAMDLSLIPMSNVARIEVYRGYVPARFSGAPIGGLAIGADLYGRYNLPLRIEFEADMPKNAVIDDIHPGYNREGVDPNMLGVSFIYGLSTSRLSYSRAKFEYRAHTAFINLYYDFHNDTRFTPYIGAGSGLSFSKTNGHSVLLGKLNVERRVGAQLSTESLDISSGDGWDEGVRRRSFAWNAGAGVAYRLTDDISIDAAYRFVNTGFDGRKGADHVNGIGRQAEGLYVAYVQVQAPKLNLRNQHQAILSLRFSF